MGGGGGGEEAYPPEDKESLMHLHHKKSSLQQVLSALLSCTTIATSFFPNLTKLAAILIVLPVTTATVERTFSSMKLIKTRLCNRMGESTLEHTMIICIEGPDRLSNETLEKVIDHYKHSKQRRISFKCYIVHLMFLRKNEPFIALNFVSGDLKFKIFWGRTRGPPASPASRAVPSPELPPPKQKFLDRTLARVRQTITDESCFNVAVSSMTKKTILTMELTKS